MDRLTTQELQQLAAVSASPCVSVLMPTHVSGREIRQDPIRWKNLLKEAEAGLVARGLRAADAHERLAPLWKLVEDGPFWQNQDRGLAAYRWSHETRIYQVPMPMPERAAVGSRCHVVPLLPVVNEDARYYVLALSPKQVRLFACSRQTTRDVELPGWPAEFAELARFIEEQAQLQFHTGAPPAGEPGDRAAMFHGHAGGDAASTRKQRLLEFCRLVDENVQKALHYSGPPLVLACDERLASIYREASDYPRVMRQPVAGNPDERRAQELSAAAWEIVRSAVEQRRADALDRLREALGTGRAASGLLPVLRSAQEGRVDTLFVASDAQRWGRYAFDQQQLDVHDAAAPDDEELVNLATVTALQQGANAYTLPQAELPDSAVTAAVLRY